MRPSIVPTGPKSPTELMEEQIRAEWGNLVESMYIMMIADGDISDAERDVAQSARFLTTPSAARK